MPTKNSISAIWMLIVLSLSSLQITAQVTEKKYVYNDTFEVIGENIIIIYDLKLLDVHDKYYKITIRANVNGQNMVPVSVSGDIGAGVQPGKGKKIIWRVLQDVEQLVGDLTIEIKATVLQGKIEQPMPPPPKENYQKEESTITDNNNSSTPTKQTPPISFPMPSQSQLPAISSGGIGLVSLVTALLMRQQSNNNYTIYAKNRIETNPIYDETSRDDLYKKANTQNQIANITTLLGAGALAGAAILFLTKRKKVKRVKEKRQQQRKNRRKFTFYPHLQQDTYQAGFSYNF